MWVLSALDYTLVICSSISALGAIIAAFVGAWVARQVRTPSGDTLGQVVERTHDLASATVAAVAGLNGESHSDADKSREAE